MCAYLRKNVYSSNGGVRTKANNENDEQKKGKNERRIFLSPSSSSTLTANILTNKKHKSTNYPNKTATVPRALAHSRKITAAPREQTQLSLRHKHTTGLCLLHSRMSTDVTRSISCVSAYIYVRERGGEKACLPESGEIFGIVIGT